MSTEQGFLAHLAAEPGDAVTRLVYADWLEERDDPRAAYLRAEAELAALAEVDPRYADLDRTVSEQAATFPQDWLAVAGHKWDVWLLGYEPTLKIPVIKVIREFTGCGLKEAKDISEALPARFLVSCSRTQAERVRAQLLVARSSWAPPDASVRVALRLGQNPTAGPAGILTCPFEVVLLGARPRRKTALVAALVSALGWATGVARNVAGTTHPYLLRAYSSEEQAQAVAAALHESGLVEVRRRQLVPLPLRTLVDPLQPLSPGTYEVRLLAYPPGQKIAVIKVIRELTGLGLKEAKDRSESLPAVLGQQVDVATAERYRAAFAPLAQVETVRLQGG